MAKIICRFALLYLIVFALTINSCKKDSQILPTKPVPIELSPVQLTLVTSENSFALDILRKTIESADPHQNIVISPLSISSALSMALNGANGSTQTAMLEALRMNGLSPEAINQSYKDLTYALLNVDKRVLIKIANSVWTEKNFVVKKPFTDILTQYYVAEGKPFDISDPNAPEAINTWISLKTNGLIKNMISKIQSNSVMLLINAIYFKGIWEHQFDKHKTVPQTFYKSDESTESVPMMKITEQYNLYKGEGFTLAEFPYGQGNFVMDVIIPDNTKRINDLLPMLNADNVNTWIDHMVMQKIELSFPRFRYGYKNELTEILTDMGMGLAFSQNADFSNIADARLRITSALHQAFIETNEEGTEAAAATVVTIGNTSSLTPSLILDHPFLYMIRETSTNSILFMGKVEDPLAE